MTTVAKMRSQTKRDYFWNTAGSAMSAGSTMILLLVVTQFMGLYAGGVFSLAFAVAQQFQSVGAFEVRPYQATDVERRFSFGTYHAARIVTCALMILGVSVYAIVVDGFTSEALVIVLVAFLRLFDAFEDVFHGEFQRLGRLDIAGRAFFFRVLVTTVSFTVAVAVTRDLATSCLIAIALSLVALVGLNVLPARGRFRLRPWFSLRPILQLLGACLPLAAGAFLSIYLPNAPKFGIEQYLSKEMQAAYAILFMPALVINLLSGFAFKPLLTGLAVHWSAGDRGRFFGVIRAGMRIVVVSTIVIFAFGWFWGIPFLNFLYGVDLGPYRAELLILVIGGAFNAAGVLLYYTLVTMRRQRAVLIGYVIAAVTIFSLCTALIPPQGVRGACLAYDVAMAVLALFWAASIAFFAHRSRSDQ